LPGGPWGPQPWAVPAPPAVKKTRRRFSSEKGPPQRAPPLGQRAPASPEKRIPVPRCQGFYGITGPGSQPNQRGGPKAAASKRYREPRPQAPGSSEIGPPPSTSPNFPVPALGPPPGHGETRPGAQPQHRGVRRPGGGFPPAAGGEKKRGWGKVPIVERVRKIRGSHSAFGWKQGPSRGLRLGGPPVLQTPPNGSVSPTYRAPCRQAPAPKR